MRRHFMLKLLGTTFFTWLFFVGYFHVMRTPDFAVLVMPLTAFDSWVPFQPGALVAYFSLWLYVGVAPGLQWSFRELVVYTLWIGGLCVAGLGIFHFWPTQVPLGMAPLTDFPGFALMQGVDAPGNACPSMHVAVAVFTAIRIEDVLRRTGSPAWLRLLNWVWVAAIVWSTLAVKQHVLLDVAGGLVLASAFALPSLRWRPDPVRALRAVRNPAAIIVHR